MAKARLKLLIAIVLTLFGMQSFAASKVLNVFNWSGYIPPKVLKLFSKETGIHVNYSTFETDEELYAKIKLNHSDYDVIVPDTYVAQRMIKENLLQKIDTNRLTNFKFLKPKLLNLSYDPHNQYTVPYLWGSTGVMVNSKYVKIDKMTAWRDFWRKRFKDKIAVLDDMRDTFAVAFIRLGYSINDENPKHIYQAYRLLKKLLPNVQSFNADGSQQMYINEDADLGMIDSGDAYNSMAENPSLYFVYPKDGVILWMDVMAIPKGAKHLANAYKFINFILQPKIAAMISAGVGYSSPNKIGIRLLPKKLQNNQILNPDLHNLKNIQMEGDINVAARRLYLKYWELLKDAA